IGVAAANLATKRAAATAVGLTGIFGYASTVLSGWGMGLLVQKYGWAAAFQCLIAVAGVGLILFIAAWAAPAHGYEEQHHEDTLGFSRMLKKGQRTAEAMLAEVTFTRYRGGVLGDFTSRLHYTTDWFFDNQQKRVVKILAPDLPGAQAFTQKVGIMSKHPEN